MATVRENLRGRIDELKTLRDEIRVELNLAGMSLRDEWKELEKRLPDPGHLARDLKAASSETLEEILEEARKFRLRLGARAGVKTVTSLMTADPVVCSPDATLAEAAHEMWQHDVGCLPVVDAEGKVTAMVTDRDACMAAYLAGTSLDRLPVRTAMSSALYSCGPETSPREAEELMRSHQIRRLPVVDAAGRLLGVVTLGDLARAAARSTGGHEGKGAGPASEDVTATLAAVVAPRTDGPPAQS
jgi:CBS domain-containing protein